MTQQARYTDYLPLSELREDPANPKEHDLGLMDASVGRFGFIEPMVLDERTGFLVSGHGRRAVLSRMVDAGSSPPDGVSVADDGSWLVPVIRGWASRSDIEAHAALAALNRVGEKGGWDDGDLLSLLDELAQGDDGLAGVGFTEADHAVLRRLAEAEAVYTTGANEMLDEFNTISGQSGDGEYVEQWEAKVTVYFRDQAAIDDFRQRLGIEGELTKIVNLPQGWTPDDRRRYPAA